MRRRFVVAFASTALAAAGCGGAGRTGSTSAAPTVIPPIIVPASTAPSSSAPSATTVSSTSPTLTEMSDLVVASSTSVPTWSSAASVTDGPLEVLVAGADGVWLWSEEGDRRQVVDVPVGAAVPDRLGGIVYQPLETGEYRPAAVDPGDAVDLAVARWAWVGEGAGQPIWHQPRAGELATVVVEPPRDGTVRLADTAVVDGHPTVAYVRTRYLEVRATETNTNPWWDSAIAELVVRDLVTGTEQVIRTQSVGWEYGPRTPTIGDTFVVDVIHEYAEGQAIELWSADGNPVDVPFEVPYCCELIGDAPPSGSWLVYATTSQDDTGRPTGLIDLEVVDIRTGAGLMSTTIAIDDNVALVSIDTVASHSLVVTEQRGPVQIEDGPELRRGDRGRWVQILQLALSTGPDVYLATDAVYGPRTEAAVRELQAASGLDATGVVDAATWEIALTQYGGWVGQIADPVLVEPDGSSRTLPAWGDDALNAGVHAGPAMTLWVDGT